VDPQPRRSPGHERSGAPLRRRVAYTSIAFTDRLPAAGIDASVDTVGDAYDNALAESAIGLFKTELIRTNGPWRGPDDVELATLEWVDWYNHRRLHAALGHVPPAEHEHNHDRERQPEPAGHSTT
jgi:putative transposase